MLIFLPSFVGILLWVLIYFVVVEIKSYDGIKILRIITCGLIHIVLFLCTNNDWKSCYVCQIKQYFMHENLNSLVIPESDRGRGVIQINVSVYLVRA